MRETLSFGIDGKKYDWRMLQRFTGRHKKQNFLFGAFIKLLKKLSTLINFRFLKNNVIFFKFYINKNELARSNDNSRMILSLAWS